ncbi:hypothetical protein [Methylomonas fluvii]|nr:hypothetical protein [Methylomonas fluvii]
MLRYVGNQENIWPIFFKIFCLPITTFIQHAFTDYFIKLF